MTGLRGQHVAPLNRPVRFTRWLRSGTHGRLLRGSREFLRGLSHRAFVQAVYRALLGREPDREGLRHYVRALSTGRTTREQVLADISHSPEATGIAIQALGMRDLVTEFCSARPADPALRPVLFLHLMKSGGRALASTLFGIVEPWPVLLDVWIDQLVCLPEPLRHQAMLVTGHLPYHARALLAPDVVACTVIREPVARTLSHLGHLRTHGGRKDLSLEAFVSSPQWRPHWENYQARQLAHDSPVDAARRGEFPRREPTGEMVTLQSLIDGAGFPPEDDLLAAALQRLEEIELVGVSDRLDDLAGRVAAVWGKSVAAPVARVNETHRPLRPDAVPRELLAAIEAGTEVDRRLYLRAVERSGPPVDATVVDIRTTRAARV